MASRFGAAARVLLLMLLWGGGPASRWGIAAGWDPDMAVPPTPTPIKSAWWRRGRAQEGEDEGSEEEAEEKASRGSGDGGDEATSSTTRAEAFLFLDEMNACRHTGLIEEAICSRTLYGKPRAPPTSHLILRLYTLSTTYVHRTKRLVSSV